MTRIAVSRRNLLEAGACVLTGAVGLPGVAKRSTYGQSRAGPTRRSSGSTTQRGRGKTGAHSMDCWPTTSPLPARTTTTTSIKAPLKRDVGRHRLILSNGSNWCG
jgi:hypothetical protein